MAGYRLCAERIAAGAAGPVLPKHIDLAVRAAEKAGAPAAEMVQLQKAGEALLQFQRAQTARAPAPRRDAPPASLPAAKALAPPLGASAFDVIETVKPMQEFRFYRVRVSSAGLELLDGGKPSFWYLVAMMLPAIAPVVLVGSFSGMRRHGFSFKELLLAAVLGGGFVVAGVFWQKHLRRALAGVLDRHDGSQASITIDRADIARAKLTIEALTVELKSGGKRTFALLDVDRDLRPAVELLTPFLGPVLTLKVRWNDAKGWYMEVR